METLYEHKALPSLGRALDMHDSRPAEKVSTGARSKRVSMPRHVSVAGSS